MAQPEPAVYAVTPWQRETAVRLVQRWDHYPLDIGKEENERRRVEEAAAVEAVAGRLAADGYDAALELAKSMGRERGVQQPWEGTLGGGSHGDVEEIALAELGAAGPSGLASDGGGGSGPGPDVAISLLTVLPGSPELPLPAEVAAAESRVRGAVAALGAENTPDNQQRVLDARAAYLDVVAAHLREMAAVPSQARTPSWRQQFVNTLAAFAGNVVGFTVPTALAQLAPNPTAATRIYSGAVAGLGIVTPELSSLIKRGLGGANEQLRLSLGDSANVGRV